MLASALFILVTPEDNAPAIPIVMAILWSLNEFTDAPIRLLVPFITIPSFDSLISAPNFESPSTVAEILSDSFILSSPASFMIVWPSAKHAAKDKIGISSITVSNAKDVYVLKR